MNIRVAIFCMGLVYQSTPRDMGDTRQLSNNFCSVHFTVINGDCSRASNKVVALLAIVQ
jgi:hypothetical protein